MGRTIITERDVEREQLKAFRQFLHALFTTQGGEIRIPQEALANATDEYSLVWYVDEHTDTIVYRFKPHNDPAPKWPIGESRHGLIDAQERFVARGRTPSGDSDSAA